MNEELVNKVAGESLPTWVVLFAIILALFAGQLLLLSKTLKVPSGSFQCMGFVLFLAFVGGFALSEIQSGATPFLPRAISYGLLATVPVGIIASLIAVCNQQSDHRYR